jgi:hypothetical protein
MKTYIYTDKNFEKHPDDVVALNIDDMDKHLDKSECTAIILEDTLDYIPNRKDNLYKIMSYMRYDGTLYICGEDIEQVAKAIFLRNITTDEALKKLFNKRESISTLGEMINMIMGGGYKIMKKYFVGTQYYIEANRAKPESK